VTLSATSENNSGVIRLIANPPFCRRFLRPSSTSRVRWWRGSGLRMMPTFPPPPLSTVRRVFPSTAGRLAFQVAPSLMSLRLSLHQAYPAHHVGLRLPFVHSVASSGAPLCVGTMDSVMHRHSRSSLLDGLGDAPPFEEFTPLPQRSSLRSGFCCPSPSTLTRPHPSHSQAHPDFAA
jgi:hypothetical protein